MIWMISFVDRLPIDWSENSVYFLPKKQNLPEGHER